MNSMETRARRRILVTGATGKQGGAVVQAILAQSSEADFEILALTRNTSSAAAKSLASNESVTLISGDLNHAEDIFEKAGGVGSIWGVFSVQLPDGKTDAWLDDNKEYRQGVDLINASVKNGVQHFVQTSVDRGPQSDTNPTNIPHFITKHRIEQHLKEQVKDSGMTYTILRPVAFMDMFTPNLPGRIFAELVATMGEKKLHMVATMDIGIFAAQAFAMPELDEYKNEAVSLAGDELNAQDCNEAFYKALHRPMPRTYHFLASLLFWVVPEVGTMFRWFRDDGYSVDIAKCRKLNANMLDLPAFLKQESAFRR